MKQTFLWGAATSAFQVEGAYAEDGRGLAITDIRSFKKSEQQADTRIAMDHYHKYQEDVALMKELGINAYRFSVSWTRIFPNGDDALPNQEGLAFYDNLVDLLIENGIEPVVTLHHYDFPMALIEKYQGWLSRASVHAFERYARFMFSHFAGRVKYWLTLNEQHVVSISNSLLGIEATDPENAAKQRYQMNHHMFLANARAIAACHELLPEAKIAPVLSYVTAYPATPAPKDVYAAMQAEDFMSFYMMDVYCYGTYPAYYINFLKERGWMFETAAEDEEILKAGKPDFMAVNWYCSRAAQERKPEYLTEILKEHPELKELAKEYYGMADSFSFVQNALLERNEWGWEIDPLGFRMALRKIYDRYHLPVMVTENGFGFRDQLTENKIHDCERIDYLARHIENLQGAIADGADIIGYFVWSMIDVLSSSEGINKRYGLVYVDRTEHDPKQLRRIKKDSFYWYQRYLKNHKYSE